MNSELVGVVIEVVTQLAEIVDTAVNVCTQPLRNIHGCFTLWITVGDADHRKEIPLDIGSHRSHHTLESYRGHHGERCGLTGHNDLDLKLVHG